MDEERRDEEGKKRGQMEYGVVLPVNGLVSRIERDKKEKQEKLNGMCPSLL